MDFTANRSSDDLRRLPGLYRRWEMTEVFEPHRNYQIEDAGTHADGTPLFAIYVSDLIADAAAIPPSIHVPQHHEKRKAS